MIYLDNAATTFPKPESVYRYTADAMRKYGANPGRSGHDLSISTAKAVYRTREAVADFFGAEKSENVMFMLNCTMGINMAIKGIVKKGDHVVISNLEHNAVARPIEKLKTRGIIDYTVAEVCECDDEKTLQNFKRAIRPNTSLLICNHASNVFGIKAPIRKIGEMCKNEGITFLVDAAQSSGIFEIDMKQDNIDILAIAPHKGLYALMGNGILINNSNKKLNTIIEGGTGSSSLSLIQPEIMPDVFESGTQNVVGIISIYHGLNAIKEVGIEKIRKHEINLICSLYKQLKQCKNVVLYTQMPTQETHAPVLSFNVKGFDSEETVAILNKKGFALRGGLHCAPLAHISHNTENIGTVRAAPSMFTTQNQINELVNAVKTIK